MRELRRLSTAPPGPSSPAFSLFSPWSPLNPRSLQARRFLAPALCRQPLSCRRLGVVLLACCYPVSGPVLILSLCCRRTRVSGKGPSPLPTAQQIAITAQRSGENIRTTPTAVHVARAELVSCCCAARVLRFGCFSAALALAFVSEWAGGDELENPVELLQVAVVDHDCPACG